MLTLKLQKISCYFGLWLQNTLGHTFDLSDLLTLNTGGLLLHCICYRHYKVGHYKDCLITALLYIYIAVYFVCFAWEYYCRAFISINGKQINYKCRVYSSTTLYIYIYIMWQLTKAIAKMECDTEQTMKLE